MDDPIETSRQIAILAIAEQYAPETPPEYIISKLWAQLNLSGGNWRVYWTTNLGDYKKYLVEFNGETSEANVTVIYDGPAEPTR